ncbi:O-antigen ligase family protein [Sphingomonas sp. LY29]|uniref:O-antigen ligase family protein n=1 Tax=Sphingomonas sp. LY29 TaxID=3095341 RepID=UPI002D76E060|nr:O-antigen ligase family protein [Sphingomonas sp. LY29]WRP26346.1 O-antigen ligase family protein [Sphingomonas sp. LY29]
MKTIAFPLTAFFFGLALAIGGAGTRYPLLEMAVEAAAIVVIFYFLAVRHGRVMSREATLLVAVVGLIVLAPLLQLVPLPPSIWHELPGRERSVEVLGLIDRADAWMPLSLDPEATKRSALALLPGIAMIVAVIHLSHAERLKLAYALVVFAILGATAGALQIASGGETSLNPFDTGHRDHGVGLFTNRNHQADFLLIAMALTAALGRIAWAKRSSPSARMIAVGTIGLFVAGTLATSSRMGNALLLLVLPAALVLLFPVRLRWKSLGIVVASISVLLVFALNNSVAQAVIARFATDDPRFDYWQDTLVAIRDFSPFGSGFGTFVPIHQSVETLSTVSSAYVNHAHNDYLELLLEGGAFAVLPLAAFVFFLGLAVRRLLRGSWDPAESVLAGAALIGIALILLHSVVDYPLRMLSLVAVFGFLCALMTRAPGRVGKRGGANSEQRQKVNRAKRGVTLGFGFLVPVALLAQVFVIGLADNAVKNGGLAGVRPMSPWSPSAAGLAAVESLRAGNPDEAGTLATDALAEAPLDVRSLSTLALVYEQQGRSAEAATLMGVAARGGWRDPVTQLWVMNRALEISDFDVAAQRADALLRRDLFREQLFPLLRSISTTAVAAQAIATRLSDNPKWRGSFMTTLADLTPAQLAAHEQILISLGRSEAPPTEAEAAAHVGSLVKSGEYRRAFDSWRRFAGAQSPNRSNVTAGDFKGLENGDLKAGAIPFKWSSGGILDASAKLGTPPTSPSGLAIQARARSGATGAVLKQAIVLDPGTYRLTFRAQTDSAAALDGFEWSVTCREGKAVPAGAATRSPEENGWITVERILHISGACPSQELRLSASGVTPGSIDAWYDDIAITKIAIPK